MGISVEIDTEVLEAEMNRLQKKFEPVGLLKAIGARTLVWIDENFDNEGGNVGGWTPLSNNTIASKGSSAILQDTGRLRQSFDYELEGDDTVRVGTNVEYAVYHEEGTGPYDITPNDPRGSLAFMTASGMVFVKMVHHPGLPQRRMLPNEVEGGELAQRLVDARLRQEDGKD